MDVAHLRCCGLDVHKKTVVACLLVRGAGTPRREIRTFSTMTKDLLAMADWLEAAECTHVAMESTGSYWKPVYNLLEGSFTLLVANAQHLKAVPGRKTDVKDAEWIAQLLQHGLLRASFIPGREEREMRELTRYRTSLIRERSAEVNRLQKTLEGANIKLASVASNIVGASGRAMLAAMIAGVDDAAELARLAQGRLREKHEALVDALSGRMSQHQRFLLAAQLRHMDDLDTVVAEISTEIERRLRPHAATMERLRTIPGVGMRVAEVLVAEAGTDMGRFPTAAHFSAWAGLCPGNDESAGKRRSGRTRKGSPWLRVVLMEAARSSSRTPTYLGAQYRRIASRRGSKRAAIAVAHSILRIAYHLISSPDATYIDLGTNYLERRTHERTRKLAIRKLESLGYAVSLDPVA
jgi:transposase